MIKPARIILDYPMPVSRSWSWRDNWVTSYDSSYALFSKFAMLNVLTAREVAQVFVSTTCGKRTAILAFPNVDLRDSSAFDLVGMSRIMRREVSDIQKSFLVEMLPNSRRKSADHLRWCTKCASTGFHTPIFQLLIVTDCPIHGIPLQAACKKCNTQIPYRFCHEAISSPFSCPSCCAPLGNLIRNPDNQVFRTTPMDIGPLVNVVKLLTFEDQILPVKHELNRQRKALGLGEVIMSQSDWRRKESEYTGFVIQVLHALVAEQDEHQRPLPLVPVTEVCRGEIAEAVIRPKRHRQRAKCRPLKSPSTIVKESWDDRLRGLYDVYKGIRRYIWRHIVHDHQACIHAAALKLWWHMEGEVTSPFCPVAETFLRWRMFWEGCGVPGRLLSSLSQAPLGIMGWHAESAPICAPGWSRSSEDWVIERIFANTCISTFRDMAQTALGNVKKQKFVWSRHSMTGNFDFYWAVTGQDSRRKPLRIYLSHKEFDDPIRKLVSYQSDKLHLQRHVESLATIQR